jgi:hypothetical protein
MKYSTLILFFLFFSFVFSANAQESNLSKKIRNDSRLDTVQARALRLLSGFSAGTAYKEVWIRDFNTFIKGSLQVHSAKEVKEMLLLFFKIQGDDGNIPDGIVDSATATGGYQYRYSPLLPGWAAHKNTVETDQESSLIQAVKKYIDVTHDRSILFEKIGSATVIQRMEAALNYIRHDRWSDRYGLVTGATTIDWGDVQPEAGWGVAINNKTKWTVDIYDNAMYVMAIKDFLLMKPIGYQPQKNWGILAKKIKTRVRKYLWDARAGKYTPHIYLNGSPFSDNFKESAIIYTGGSICAILAGFNTPSEIREINNQILAATRKEKFATIGMTVYPPYPANEFLNMPPFTYQNGGDWTWFGGRMTAALLANRQSQEAYDELVPMIERVISHDGFFEWYDVRSGQPKGSGNFRGEAGVLYDAISTLKHWAVKHQYDHKK